MTRAQDAVQLTRALVQMNTINPPGREQACARYLGTRLESAGFKVEYRRFGEGRESLIATIGRNNSPLPLCFTGHIDTVPLGAVPWSTDPFAGDVDAGLLYGRGASDMKSGVAAFTIAGINMAKHVASTCGIKLVITAGEETGCEGAFDLYHAGLLGSAGALVVAEPSGNYPLVGHKGALWLKAKTQGVTAHGSMPETGVNAVYKAARAVCLLERFRFSNAPHPLMGQATLNVGTLHGGLNINSVPDQAEIGVDIRTVPTVNHKALIGDLREQLGPDVQLETTMDLDAVWTEPRDPWIQSVFDILAPVLGESPVPRVASYFTDAAALRRAYDDIPTVIIGPGEPQMAHQTDEYCVVDRVEKCVVVYEEIIRRWCLG